MRTAKGSVFKEDGSWSVTYYLTDMDLGKKVRKFKRGFRTKWEAQEFQRQMEDSKGKITKVGVTLAQYCDIWKDGITPNKYSANTLETYLCRINKYIKPSLLGKTKLIDIDEELIKKYLKNVRENHNVSEQTVKHHYALIKMLLNKAKRDKLIASNPMDDVDVPIPDEYIYETWDEKEIKKAISFIDVNNINGLVIIVALTTGMRLGEILGLKYSDIDFTGGMIMLRQSLVKTEGENGDLKNKHSKRGITIPSNVVKLLMRYKERNERNQTLLGKEFKNEEGFIFIKEDFSRIKQDCVSKYFQRFIEKNGLKKIRFHDLRHTHATILLKSNENPKVVQERLGHSKISTTMDTYSHVQPSMQLKVADKIQELLFT